MQIWQKLIKMSKTRSILIDHFNKKDRLSNFQQLITFRISWYFISIMGCIFQEYQEYNVNFLLLLVLWSRFNHVCFNIGRPTMHIYEKYLSLIFYFRKNDETRCIYYSKRFSSTCHSVIGKIVSFCFFNVYLSRFDHEQIFLDISGWRGGWEEVLIYRWFFSFIKLLHPSPSFFDEPA